MGNIYLIRNDTNNDIYIGKTTKTIKERFNQHLYNAKKYTEIQTHLYRAIRKYGDHNFSVSPLEENISSDILNEKERYWISELKPSYNMTDGVYPNQIFGNLHKRVFYFSYFLIWKIIISGINKNEIKNPISV